MTSKSQYFPYMGVHGSIGTNHCPITDSYTFTIKMGGIPLSCMGVVTGTLHPLSSLFDNIHFG